MKRLKRWAAALGIIENQHRHDWKAVDRSNFRTCYCGETGWVVDWI